MNAVTVPSFLKAGLSLRSDSIEVSSRGDSSFSNFVGASPFFFAGISTFYLLLAMPWEERALVTSCGKQYETYRGQVRYRLVPYVY